MPRLPATVVLAALVTLLAGCGSDKEKTAASGKGAAAGQGTAATREGAAAAARRRAGPPRCRRVAAPRPRREATLKRPSLQLDEARTYRAVFDTSCGRFTVTLDVKQSPKTTASFVSLARKGFYDDTTFHRIVPGFVIQGGDPQGTGQGGPGYSVVEPPPSGTRYTKGTVAMAKTEIEDPGTSGSQFYVVTAPDAGLPPDYALLGKVTSGQDVVQRIVVVPTDTANPDPNRRERPIQPVVLRAVTVTESGR